jgi:hypothetical protein
MTDDLDVSTDTVEMTIDHLPVAFAPGAAITGHLRSLDLVIDSTTVWIPGDARLDDRGYCLWLDHRVRGYLEPIEEKPWDMVEWPDAAREQFDAYAVAIRAHATPTYTFSMPAPVVYPVVDLFQPELVSSVDTYVPSASGRWQPEVKTAPTSPWADAIGPVYTDVGMADALGISTAAVSEATDLEALLAIVLDDTGDRVYPVAQVLEGAVVGSLSWILGRLPARFLDRADLAVWMNLPQPELDDKTIWAFLRSSESSELDVRLVDLVGRYRAQVTQ